MDRMISVVVGKQRVTGRLRQDEETISVTITSPYSGFVESNPIPRNGIVVRPDESSATHAELIARHLLVGLYDRVHHFRTHYEGLKIRVRPYLAAIDQLDCYTRSDYRTDRDTLDRELINKQITPSEYEQAERANRKRLLGWELGVSQQKTLFALRYLKGAGGKTLQWMWRELTDGE